MFQSQAFAESAMTDEPPIPRDYYARKVAGLCTRCGEPAAEDSQLCDQHRLEARKLRRESHQRLRAERFAAGRCVDCDDKSDTYRCKACFVRYSRSRRRGDDKGGHKAVTTPPPVSNKGARRGTGIWRVGTTDTDDGTIRYRGQGARGAPSQASLDEQDLKQIEQLYERGRTGLRYVNGDHGRELPAAQRREALQAALSLLALAGRFLDELLDRRKYKP